MKDTRLKLCGIVLFGLGITALQAQETIPATGRTNYTISGTSQILSVPYALHAKTAEHLTGTIMENDPVFVASPANTITGVDITNWNDKLTEVDSSATDELQILSIRHDTLYLSKGGFVDLPAEYDGTWSQKTMDSHRVHPTPMDSNTEGKAGAAEPVTLITATSIRRI
jgi:hypothetical protein